MDCVVDRASVARTIEPGSVNIEAEQYRGSIIVLAPGGLKDRLPFAAKVTTLTHSQDESEYLSKRKLTLVNGIHTVIAFMTLVNNYTGFDKEYVLNKYTHMSREDQSMVESWRCARIAELLDHFSLSDLMTWHQKDTREEVSLNSVAQHAAM